MRDAENRLTFCGYDPCSFKLLVDAFRRAVLLAGGALYVGGYINPGEMSPTNSVEAGHLGGAGRSRHAGGPVDGRRWSTQLRAFTAAMSRSTGLCFWG